MLANFVPDRYHIRAFIRKLHYSHGHEKKKQERSTARSTYPGSRDHCNWTLVFAKNWLTDTAK